MGMILSLYDVNELIVANVQVASLECLAGLGQFVPMFRPIAIPKASAMTLASQPEVMASVKKAISDQGFVLFEEGFAIGQHLRFGFFGDNVIVQGLIVVACAAPEGAMDVGRQELLKVGIVVIHFGPLFLKTEAWQS